MTTPRGIVILFLVYALCLPAADSTAGTPTTVPTSQPATSPAEAAARLQQAKTVLENEQKELEKITDLRRRGLASQAEVNQQSVKFSQARVLVAEAMGQDSPAAFKARLAHAEFVLEMEQETLKRTSELAARAIASREEIDRQAAIVVQAELRVKEAQTAMQRRITTQPATAPTTRYHLYWLTPVERSQYVDLLISTKPITELSAARPDSTKPPAETAATIVKTYAKDSIWNTDGRPFKNNQAVQNVDADKRTLEVNGKEYRYEAATLQEVISLLEKPEGTIKIHRTHPPIAGAEDIVAELLDSLKKQQAIEKASK